MAAGRNGNHALFNVPKVDNIVVDGDGSDWGDRGFKVGILAPPAGVMRPAADFDSSCRLGWDDRGLLALVQVSDNHRREAQNEGDIRPNDCVQLFVVSKEAGLIELVFSPGTDPKRAELRMVKNDHRKGENLPALRCEAVRKGDDKGYTLEVLVPFSNFQPAPKQGDELGLMVITNDVDADGVRYSPRWLSSPEYKQGLGARLSEVSSAMQNGVVLTGAYENFRRTRLRVDAAAEYVGRPLAICTHSRVLCEGKLAAEGARAAFDTTAPMPPLGSPLGELTVMVNEKPLATLDMPDSDEARVKALMSEPVNLSAYVITDKKLPKADFDQPSRAEDIIGPYEVKTTFYDREYDAVTSADKPGRYGAVVEITPQVGRVIRRFRTLFRAPGAAPTAKGETPPLPDYLGIPASVEKNQAKIIATYFSGVAEAIAKSPSCAVALAGLFEAAANDPEEGVYDDPFARNREWWVGLKRKFYGLDKEFKTSVKRPTPIKGEPAPVLTEGKPEQAGFKPEAVEKIGALLEKWAKESDEGFSVCLARNGIVFLNKVCGKRDGRAMTVDDMSNITFLTKMMGGALMMELVDQGLVALDDPVSKYLPSWRDVTVEKPVTIRDLFLHTTGWREDQFISDDVVDADEIVASYVPYFKPGAPFEYATTTYTIAGKIIEAVSGESLPQFYRKHLTAPLGCANCDAAYMGYGTNTTATDLARFGQMLLNGGAYGGERFFSEDSFSKMLPPAGVPKDEMDSKRGIGVRWYSIKGLGDRILGHNAASGSILRVDLDNNLVIAMCRNAAGKNFDKYESPFFEAIAQGLAK